MIFSQLSPGATMSLFFSSLLARGFADRATVLAFAAAVCMSFGSNAVQAQSDNNPSPAAGGSASQKANAAADKAMYRAQTYANAKKKGPNLVVIPGEVKSNNATFTQRYGANNIADYAELELSKANFGV